MKKWIKEAKNSRGNIGEKLMSVIFGIVEKKSIIIAGDRRASSVDGAFISDDEQKVMEVNEHLGIAASGNVAIGKAILKNIVSREDRDYMIIDDLVKVIQEFYENIVREQCNSIYNLPFYCLIAGEDMDGKGHLVNAGRFKSGFAAKEVPMALYSPNDVDQDTCNQIFVKNYKLFHSKFCERTVQDIAGLSETVSFTGNKWIYNCISKRGKMYFFRGMRK